MLVGNGVWTRKRNVLKLTSFRWQNCVSWTLCISSGTFKGPQSCRPLHISTKFILLVSARTQAQRVVGVETAATWSGISRCPGSQRWGCSLKGRVKKIVLILVGNSRGPEHCTLVVIIKVFHLGASVVVQWLRLCTSTVQGLGSIPGWGTKIPHAAHCGPPKIFFHLIWRKKLEFQTHWIFFLN